MLSPTKIHRDLIGDDLSQHSIRIGKTVPDGAVNLAYYHNPQAESEANVLVADAPKQTINHMVAQKFMEIDGCLAKDDNLFPTHILYQDEEGYMGYIERDSVTWESVTEESKREVTTTRETYTPTQEVPNTITYEEYEHTGTLALQQVEYEAYETIQMPVEIRRYKDEQRYMVKENLTEPRAEWPDVYADKNGITDVVVDGYTGKLKKVLGQERYRRVTEQTIGQAVVKTKIVNSVEKLPNSFIENGVVYELVDVEKTEADYKRFGVVRYFGNFYGSEDRNGIYGNAIPSGNPYYSENVYLTDGTGTKVHGRGHFSDTYPKIPASIWRGSEFSALVTDVSNDGSNLPDRDTLTYDQGHQDEFWTLDTTYSPTGHVWADEWIQKNAFPPKGYEVSGGGDAILLNSDESPNMNHLNVGEFNDEYGRKAYYVPTSDRGNAQIESGRSWYRDAIAFYRIHEVVVKGYYVGHVPDGSQDTWRGEQLYRGTLYKTETEMKEDVSVWKASATYAGYLTKNYTSYTGSAYYKGLVAKHLADGNIEPKVQAEFLMSPNKVGYLETATGKTELSGERFFVASEYKDGTPLYYEGRLTYPIYYPHEVGDFEYYHGDGIRLVNAAGRKLPRNYRYQIKLKPHEEQDVYWVYIYTNFKITNKQKVLAIYNAYDPKDKGVERIKINHEELIYVQPYLIPNQHYHVHPSKVTSGYNQLLVNDNRVIKDERRKIPCEFMIRGVYSKLESENIYVDAVNEKFAFPKEKVNYLNGRQIVSPKENSRYLTPYEIVLRNNPGASSYELEALKNDIFEIKIKQQSESQQVRAYVDPTGKGVVTIETTEDTGFYNPETMVYDRMIPLDIEYIVKGINIYPAYTVKCLDVQSIKLEAPREKDLLENWYPRILNGRHTHIKDLNGTKTQLTYSLPEFETAFYSEVYGRPFVDVKQEKAKVIGDKMIVTQFSPLSVVLDDDYKPKNLRVYKQNSDGQIKLLTIDSWSYSDGVISLYDVVSENDNLLIDYTYEERSYTYRGYVEDDVFIDLDLNPNQYHTFMDTRTKPYRRQPVYELFNSIVYFFVRPSSIQPLDFEGNPIPSKLVENENVIYHQFNNSVSRNPETDLLIGSVYIRHNTSFKSTVVVDTRKPGGGVIEQMNDHLRRQLEPESDFYWDIGYWDGQPYNENGVVIVRLDSRLLIENGGQFKDAEIQEAVHKWIGFGVFPIIEYVEVLKPEDSPQQTLEIESEFE